MTDRITRMTEKGAALIMGDSYEDADAAKQDLKVRFRKALEKLYAYEELGLDAEEIADQLKATETIHSRLNTVVTWISPHKEKAYKMTLAAVRTCRDEKTGKLRQQAELTDPKRNTIIADIKHICEINATEL